MAAKMVRFIRMFGLKLSFLKYIHFSKEPIGLVSVHTFFFQQEIPLYDTCTGRVSSDLENLEMSGNFAARRKSQGKVREFLKKTGKFREFCCVKSIFSQYEHPNFENFLGEHATRAP